MFLSLRTIRKREKCKELGLGIGVSSVYQNIRFDVLKPVELFCEYIVLADNYSSKSMQQMKHN
jgi:hypothetical protein